MMRRTLVESLLFSRRSACRDLALAAAARASSPQTPAAPATLTVAPARGIVMGGQQPVAGVTLQLYQAGTTGYGSAATPLGPSVQTTSAGNFNLPSYTCTAGSQVYLVGTGGQPIAATMSSPAVTNNNLALMVGLGTCGGTDLNNFINVNELTTVASVWALAPFMTGIANIGSSSTNAAGLANAFAAINEVVNTANGTIPGPALPAGATLPHDRDQYARRHAGAVHQLGWRRGGRRRRWQQLRQSLRPRAERRRHRLSHGHHHRR